MGFWTREKKDGQKTLGYGVFLTVGLAALALILYGASKLAPPAPTVQPKRPGSAVKLGDAGRAAAEMREAREDERPRDSSEISDRGVAGAANTSRSVSGFGPGENLSSAPKSITPEGEQRAGLASINLALRLSEDARKPEIEEGTGLFPARRGERTEADLYAPLTRTIPLDQHGGQGGQHSQGPAAMVVYSADSDAVLQREISERETKAAEAGGPSHFIPRGEWIPAILLTTVEDGNFKDVFVELGIRENVYFNHRLQIPFGTRIIARVDGVPVRDKIQMSTQALRYPSGLEIPLMGAVRGNDRSPGVSAYYYAPEDWVQIAPQITAFISSWTAAMREGTRTPVSVTIGNSPVTVGMQQTFDPGKEAQIAGYNALQELLTARIKEGQERFGSRLVIPAGTLVQVQLLGPVDLSLAHKKPRNQSEKASIALASAEYTQAANDRRAVADTVRNTGSSLAGAAQNTANATSSLDQLLNAAARQSESSSQNTSPSVINALPVPNQTGDPSGFFPKR